MKKKNKFEGWRWDCIDAEVYYNLPSKLEIYFYWPIIPKKNSRRNFWHISLPSANYVEWHKRVTDKLEWEEWLYNRFPCKITITSISGNLVKSDIDNMTQSIMDTFTDLGIIPDDNKFVVQELNIRNVGYAKNCFITKVLIEPYNLPQLNDKKDYKNVDLKEMKQSLLFFSDLR